MPDTPEISIVLNGKSVTFAPHSRAHTGPDLVTPYWTNKAGIKTIIAAGEDDAVKHLHRMSEAEKRDFGRPLEEMVPFLKELLQLDQERRKKRNKLQSRPGKELGLAAKEGLRLARKPFYGKRPPDFSLDKQKSATGVKLTRRWDGYELNLLKALKDSIGEGIEEVRKCYLLENGKIDFVKYQDMMHRWFRLITADGRKKRRKIGKKKEETKEGWRPPEYDDKGSRWPSSADESKVGAGREAQGERLSAGYRAFRRKLFSGTPEAALKKLDDAQKAEGDPVSRCMVPAFIDDMNYFLVELPYTFGIARVLQEMRGHCEPATIQFNRRFFHCLHLGLDGMVPALHPFGEMLARSEPFLKIAHAYYQGDGSAESEIPFRGALLAAAKIYNLRCKEERDADSEAKEQKRRKPPPSEYQDVDTDADD